MIDLDASRACVYLINMGGNEASYYKQRTTMNDTVTTEARDQKALHNTLDKLAKQIDAALESDNTSMIVEVMVINTLLKKLSSSLDKEIFLLNNNIDHN